MTDARERRRFAVFGRVQGVGFRWFSANAGRSLGLVGWVRNRADGSVEAEAEGDPETLDAFAAQLSDGPTFARVDRVDVRVIECREDEARFEIGD